FLRFDFDPLHLKNPRTESMSALLDLMRDPNATPYAMEILAPSLEAAAALAARLESLPEVDHVMTLESFVPAEQPEKLALIQDAGFLLEPTLTPNHPAASPDDAALLQAAGDLIRELRALGPDRAGAASALALARVLERALRATPPPLEGLRATLAGDLPALL